MKSFLAWRPWNPHGRYRRQRSLFWYRIWTDGMVPAPREWYAVDRTGRIFASAHWLTPGQRFNAIMNHLTRPTARGEVIDMETLIDRYADQREGEALVTISVAVLNAHYGVK